MPKDGRYKMAEGQWLRGGSRWIASLSGALVLATTGCRIQRRSPQEVAVGDAAVSTALPATTLTAASGLEADAAVAPGPSTSELALDAGARREVTVLDARARVDPEPTAPVSGHATPPGWSLLAYAGGVSLSRPLARSLAASLGRAAPAVVAARAVAALEGLEETNAGPGAALRLDGSTVECDALVQDASGRVGRALGVRRTLQPVALAEALYRAGGATVRGAATDELARRLGLELGSLRAAAAEREYDAVLSSVLREGATGERGAWFSLYVDPQRVARALKAPALEGEETLDPPRDPVVAVVLGPDDRWGLAMSLGGVPLAPPGAPSLLDDPELAPRVTTSGAAIVFGAPGEPCPGGAALLLERWDALRSWRVAEQALQRRCRGARFLLATSGGWRSNWEADALLVAGELAGASDARSEEPVPEPETEPTLDPTEKASDAVGAGSVVRAQRPLTEPRDPGVGSVAPKGSASSVPTAQATPRIPSSAPPRPPLAAPRPAASPALAPTAPVAPKPRAIPSAPPARPAASEAAP